LPPHFPLATERDGSKLRLAPFLLFLLVVAIVRPLCYCLSVEKFNRNEGKMAQRDSGKRGRGEAKFFWKKDRSAMGYPINDESAYKLTELAEIRSRLFDGKKRSDDRTDEMLCRQECLIQMLGEDGILVTTIEEMRRG
jgi:hypothetical protein